MDPAGRGVMWQRFGENVVLAAAPNEDTPEKQDRAIYLSQPLGGRLSPVYVFIFLHMSPARACEPGRSMQ